MTNTPPRSRAQRRRDTEHRLGHDVDVSATRTARLALGHTRDVAMIEGDVEVLASDALPPHPGDRFAARTGFDPRSLTTPYRWFRITPHRIRAWREENELSDRELMRDGRRLA
ncbi:pyridoxamine 5'-phosphate oxidase family protein [Streptomyces sp. NPDC059382]|uniref:pyridoxamine 5'-phosphate oxidase family protein n=1 Tax=Streptomyces sp. NPDC059382 TaxID=3346816 RepID=UPI0036CD4459